MIKFLPFVPLFFFLNLQSQEVKTMTESYDEGELTFQYYEDPETSAIVKHGVFEYYKSLEHVETAGYFKLKVIGSFKDGFRNGRFLYSISMKDYPNNGNSFTTKTTNTILNYQEGFPHGDWEVDSKWKTRDRKYNYSNSKYYWTPYSEEFSEKAKTSFLSGVAIGNTVFKKAESNQTISFTLNKTGFMVGDYIFKDMLYNFDLEFDKNGVMTKSVIRDKRGEVESQSLVDEEMLSAVEQYARGSISAEGLQNERIQVDTITNALSFLDYNYIFEKAVFLFREIGGDKTLSDISSEINRSYKKIIQIKRIPYLDLKKNGEYQNIGYEFDKEKKYKRYSDFLEQNQFQLDDKSRKELKTKIQIAKIEFDKEKRNGIQTQKVQFETMPGISKD